MATENKGKTIAGWVLKVLFAFALAGSGLMSLTKNPAIMESYTALGLPAYLGTLLGTWKLLGVIALFVPKFPTVREWAYAGFFFNLSGAIYVHIAAGDPISKAVAPVILVGLLLAARFFDPTHHQAAGDHS